MGVSLEILDNPDAELVPSLENRKLVTKKIREFRPDIVITHRPNDYHPDHRYTSALVQDSMYMLCVPFFVADVAPLQKNPVLLYFEDKFEKPTPFQFDIVVDILSTYKSKVDALDQHKSQFYEWLPWIERREPPKNKEEMMQWLNSDWYLDVEELKKKISGKFDAQFVQGLERAEAFEISELGSPISKEEIETIFEKTKYGK